MTLQEFWHTNSAALLPLIYGSVAMWDTWKDCRADIYAVFRPSSREGRSMRVYTIKDGDVVRIVVRAPGQDTTSEIFYGWAVGIQDPITGKLVLDPSPTEGSRRYLCWARALFPTERVPDPDDKYGSKAIAVAYKCDVCGKGLDVGGKLCTVCEYDLCESCSSHTKHAHSMFTYVGYLQQDTYEMGDVLGGNTSFS